MSKHDKLLIRLLSKPKTFDWNDLRTVLQGLGYQELQGSGSRVKFYHAETKDVISLHQPHPGNDMKVGAIKDVANHLKEKGYER